MAKYNPVARPAKILDKSVEDLAQAPINPNNVSQNAPNIPIILTFSAVLAIE